jgi:hypothetical protein
MEWEESRQFILEQTAKIYRYGKKGHLKPVEKLSTELFAIIKDM